jgi:hypothetical protein
MLVDWLKFKVKKVRLTYRYLACFLNLKEFHCLEQIYYELEKKKSHFYYQVSNYLHCFIESLNLYFSTDYHFDNMILHQLPWSQSTIIQSNSISQSIYFDEVLRDHFLLHTHLHFDSLSSSWYHSCIRLFDYLLLDYREQRSSYLA